MIACKKNSKNGFSLLELLCIIAIMGIMSVIAVPAYVANKKAKAVAYAKIQITNDVRYIQDSTLSGMKFPGASYPPKGGYGIRLQQGSGSYLIFGDKENGASDPNKAYDTSNGEMVEGNISLGEGVIITRLQYCTTSSSSSCSDVSAVDFVCTPPYGDSFVNGTKPYSIKVFLGAPGTSATANLVITLSGSIK